MLCALLGACSLTRAPTLAGPAAAIEQVAAPVAPAPVVPAADAIGSALLANAQRFLGVPYRFGGDAPRGFDCSGLVHYAHALAGLSVPRTAAGQQISSRHLARGELAPGDLVFFASRPGGEIDHVGIYAGDGRFIHAPGRGRVVEYAGLDDPWFRTRWAGGGRFRQGRPP
jgi:cell wall-associated NlpC family hydrolase